MKEKIKQLATRYFIDALRTMALGLFASLIVGLILQQISMIRIGNLSFEILGKFAEVAKNPMVVGGAIGVAIAYGMKHSLLVIFASAVTGAYGYLLGGPVGAYCAALVGAEIGGWINSYAKKIRIDIIATPLATIIAGCFIGHFVGGPISSFMTWLGSIINSATELAPFPMGIIVAVIVGLCLTAPISSAALCIMLGLEGLAAGAATVGCAAQMIGFATISFRDNGWGGVLAQGLGTSMLQVPNIVRKPQLLLPPTIAGAILGPIATCVFRMKNISLGAGMGTSGFVGQIGTFQAMAGEYSFGSLSLIVLLLHFVLPCILSLLVYVLLRKIGWIQDKDMVIEVE